MTKVSSDKMPNFENSTQIATIIVGDEKKEWNISTDLLRVHSGYFRSALKGGFIEAQIRRVELLNEEPPTFELVVEWLFTHGIKERHPRPFVETKFDFLQPEFRKLFEAYILAEYLQMPALQNYLIKFMNDRVAKYEYVSESDFAWAFEQVGGQTPLGRWIVNCCAQVMAFERLVIGPLVDLEAAAAVEEGEEPTLSTEELRTISTKAAGLFGIVLADESHKLKSVFTRTHQSIARLGAQHMLLITTTPTINKSIDFPNPGQIEGADKASIDVTEVVLLILARHTSAFKIFRSINVGDSLVVDPRFKKIQKMSRRTKSLAKMTRKEFCYPKDYIANASTITTFDLVRKALSTLKALRGKELRAEDARLEELDEYLRKIKAAADMFNATVKASISNKELADHPALVNATVKS
ncbi:hypothetical protein VE00_00406 [Pseudogymnoascus sp. WSF 3629]|nr:hypothetical protein VE00_00406 [Pseudogymnoascus sp. WSF 3629]